MEYRVSVSQLSEVCRVKTRAARRYLKSHCRPAGAEIFLMTVGEIARAREALRGQSQIVVTGVMLEHPRTLRRKVMRH